MIDEKKLLSIQKNSRRIAIGGFIAFIALIGYSAYKLYSINREIAQNSQELSATKAELADTYSELNKNKEEIRSQEERLAALKQELSLVSASLDNVYKKSPKLVEEAVIQAEEANPKVADAGPRIYIHIIREDQRPKAKQVADALQNKGYIVLGIENVGKTIAFTSNSLLKVFRRAEQESKDADDIMSFLQGMGVKVEKSYNIGYKNIRPRQYELWFGPDF